MNKVAICDVDGVLADFILGFTTLAAGAGFLDHPYGTSLHPTWEFDPDVLSKDQEHRLWGLIKSSPSFWRELPLLADPLEMMNLGNLAMGIPVYFVTARVGATAKWQTERWLHQHGIIHPTVIISKNKGEMARAVNATHLIDDKAGNVIATTWISPDTKSYIIDRPYNQVDPAVVGGKVRRVRTVGEWIEEIQK